MDHGSLARKAFISRSTSASLEMKTAWLVFANRTTRAKGIPDSNAFACAVLRSRSSAAKAARAAASIPGNGPMFWGMAKNARTGHPIALYFCAPVMTAMMICISGVLGGTCCFRDCLYTLLHIQEVLFKLRKADFQKMLDESLAFSRRSKLRECIHFFS